MTEHDFARSANLTVKQCLEKQSCPICGATMKIEIHYELAHITTYWCDKSNNHVFEIDEETDCADRVPM